MNKKKDTIELVDNIPENVLEELVQLEKELFPEHLRSGAEEIRDIFSTKENVKVLAYCPEGRIAGYVTSKHHHKAREEMKEVDPEMEHLPNAIYLTKIAVRNDLQGKGYFGMLMRKFNEGANGKPISMHARVVNNCSLKMQKYGAKFMRSKENWRGSGETFDYLIIQSGFNCAPE